MSDSYAVPNHEYVVYIDESGDPGLETVFPVDPDGASEWLCFSAIVIDRKREAETVSWLQEIRRQAKITQGPSLHFRLLTPDRKREVCQFFATKELRGFVVCCHKVNMRQHRNERAAKIPSKQWFYNWCSRLLLERVTDWVERHSVKTFGSPRHAKIIFSESGKHSYSQTRAYYFILRQQARSGSTYLQRRQIKPSVLDWRLVESKPHQQSAGLQIADSFVSAFYQAVDFNKARPWTTEYAELLKPRMARENGLIADYGVTLWPFWRKDRRVLLNEQKKIFRFYGEGI
jgi:hypothetical protein